MVKYLKRVFILFFFLLHATAYSQQSPFHNFRLDYIPIAFTLSTDSSELIVASANNIYRYNCSTGNLISSFRIAKPPKNIMVSTDGKRLLMRHDGSFMPCYFDTTSSSVYDLGTGKLDSRIASNIYFENVYGIKPATLLAENKMVQGKNCMVAIRSNLLWLKNGGSNTGKINSRISALGLHPDGKHCAVVTNGNLLHVLEGDSLREILQRTLPEIGDYGLVFSGRHLIVSGNSNLIGSKQTLIVNLETFKVDSFDFFADSEVKHFCVSADGKYLALNDGFANVAIFDLLSQKVVFKETIFGWIFQCYQMAFYKNSHKLLLAGLMNSNDKHGLINLFDFKDYSLRYQNYTASTQRKTDNRPNQGPNVKDQNPYFEENYKGKKVLLDTAIHQVVTQTSSVIQFWNWPDLLKTQEVFFQRTKAYSYNKMLHRAVYITEVVAEPGQESSFKLSIYDFEKNAISSIHFSEIKSDKKLESYHFSEVELMNDTIVLLYGTVSNTTYLYSCDFKNKIGFLLEKAMDKSTSGAGFEGEMIIAAADKTGNKLQTFSYKPFSSDWKLKFESKCPSQQIYSGNKLTLVFASYAEVWDLRTLEKMKVEFPFSQRDNPYRLLFSVSPDEKLLALANDTARGTKLYIYKNERWLKQNISENLYGEITTDNKGLVFVADDNAGILQIDFNTGKQLQNIRRNDYRFNHFQLVGKFFNLGNTIYDMSKLMPAVNALGESDIFLKDGSGNYFKAESISNAKSYSDYTSCLVEYNQLGDSIRAYILPEKGTTISKAVSLFETGHVVIEYFNLYENSRFIRVFNVLGKTVFARKKEETGSDFFWQLDGKGKMYVLDYSNKTEKHFVLDLQTEETTTLKSRNDFNLRDTIFDTWNRNIRYVTVSNNKTIHSYYHPYFIEITRVSYNYRKIVSAMETGDIYIWNIDNEMKPEYVFNPHGRAPFFMQLFDSVLVSGTVEGGYWFFNIKTGKELFRFYSFTEKYGTPVYAFFNDSGYYTASKQASGFLHFEYKNKPYDLQQFDLIYNRPDIVLSSAGTASPNQLNILQLAVKKQQAMGRQQSIKQLEDAPHLEIQNKASLPATTNEKFIDLRIFCKSNTAKLKVFHITINDVPLFGSRGLPIAIFESMEFSKNIQVELSSGRNLIKAWCNDDNGVSSLTDRVVIECGTISAPKIYFIGIGINEYLTGNNLSYAVGDIDKIADYFRWHYKADLIIDTFLNSRASRQNILGVKNLLLQTKVDDKVIVAFSGHGLLNRNLDFYFSTYEVDFKQPENGGISLAEMEQLLDSLPARQKLLLIDACHSGLVDKSVGYVRPAVAGIVEKAAKGSELLIDENDSSKQLTLAFDMMQELFQQFSNQTGTTIISAAAGREYALENDQWKNGAFTYSLIHGLGSRKADQNKDRKITLSELKWYLSVEVPKLTGGRQRPSSRNDSNANDWVIW